MRAMLWAPWTPPCATQPPPLARRHCRGPPSHPGPNPYPLACCFPCQDVTAAACYSAAPPAPEQRDCMVGVNVQSCIISKSSCAAHSLESVQWHNLPCAKIQQPQNTVFQIDQHDSTQPLCITDGHYEVTEQDSHGLNADIAVLPMMGSPTLKQPAQCVGGAP